MNEAATWFDRMWLKRIEREKRERRGKPKGFAQGEERREEVLKPCLWLTPQLSTESRVLFLNTNDLIKDWIVICSFSQGRKRESQWILGRVLLAWMQRETWTKVLLSWWSYSLFVFLNKRGIEVKEIIFHVFPFCLILWFLHPAEWDQCEIRREKFLVATTFRCRAGWVKFYRLDSLFHLPFSQGTDHFSAHR